MRAARALLFALALSGSVACAETGQGPLAGASDAWAHAPEPTSAPPASQPQAEWEAFREVLRLPIVTAAPFTTRGHLPQQSVDVRANDLARPGYLALVTDTVFPDGSVLAELPHGATGSGYVMRKAAGRWQYLELDSRGAVVTSGSPPLCTGCHAQAPSDQVFGLPRAP